MSSFGPFATGFAEALESADIVRIKGGLDHDVFAIGPNRVDVRLGSDLVANMLVRPLLRGGQVIMMEVMPQGVGWLNTQFSETATGSVLRLTAIAEFRRGAWRIRALHFSRGVSAKELQAAIASGYQSSAAPITNNVPPRAAALRRSFENTLTSAATFRRSLSDTFGDLALYGSAPTEYYAGEDAVRDALRSWTIPLERRDGVRAEVLGDGSVGWIAANLSTGSPTAEPTTYRVLIVYIRENRQWRFVQAHFSNEADMASMARGSAVP